MSNKVVITGHATNLGKSIADKLTESGYEINGYDWKINPCHNLWSEDVRKQVIEDCKDASIFVNNAIPGQLYFLEKLHELWYNQEKLIINIGTAATYFMTFDQFKETLTPDETILETYFLDKQKLDNKQKELYYIQTEKKCTGPAMVMIRPGFLNTDFHSDRQVSKLDIEYVAYMIDQIVKNADKFLISDMVIKSNKNG
jgi:hypothetical protein